MVRLGIYLFVIVIVLSAAQCATACMTSPADRSQPSCHQHQKMVRSCSHPVVADEVAHAPVPQPAVLPTGSVLPPMTYAPLAPFVGAPSLFVSPPASHTVLRV